MTTLTIVDQSPIVESCASVRAACAKGAKFIRTELTRINWCGVLESLLKPGDTLIDLTFGISCLELLEWCQTHDVTYINTAIERWEDELIVDNCKLLDSDMYEERGKEYFILMYSRNSDGWTSKHKDLYDRTLYARHLEIMQRGFDKCGPTAVLEHGMPFIILPFSIFTFF